jgi:TonB family protein
MKYKLLPAAILFAATLATAPALAQNHTTEDEKIYEYVEQMPQFQGGMRGMTQFVSARVSYTAEQPDGMVVLSFVVDKDGSVDEVKVIKSLVPELDEACVNAVKETEGRWTPGVHKGENVPVRFTLPLKFGRPDLETVKSETMPEYKGGVVEFKRFMKANVTYPKKAKKHGTVIVGFTINEDGSLSNYQIKRSIEPILDDEALRLAKLTEGNWLPAVKDGQRVKVRYTMPVIF